MDLVHSSNLMGTGYGCNPLKWILKTLSRELMTFKRITNRNVSERRVLTHPYDFFCEYVVSYAKKDARIHDVNGFVG